MHRLTITSAAAGILGLILIVLSVLVVMQRRSAGAGTDQPPALLVAIRSHANFIEYVPMCLLLIGFIEARFGSTWYVAALAVGLIASRIAHPFGMTKPPPNAPRAAGFVGSILVLLAASIMAIAASF